MQKGIIGHPLLILDRQLHLCHDVRRERSHLLSLCLSLRVPSKGESGWERKEDILGMEREGVSAKESVCEVEDVLVPIFVAFVLRHSLHSLPHIHTIHYLPFFLGQQKFSSSLIMGRIPGS